MRPELKLIELIEKYLQNELEEKDRKEFELRIKNNPEFKEEVELQKKITDGVESLALKKVVEKAYHKYRFKRKLIRSIGFASAAIIAGLVTYYTFFSHESKLETWFDRVLGSELTYDDDILNTEFFEISGSENSTIETEGGIVFAIPAGAFVDEDGNTIEGKIELETKEAIEAEDILQAGLSTTSNGRLLETGGMFYLNAESNNKRLRIREDAEVLVEVPTDSLKSNMQLFDGERLEDGSINWVKPIPIENYLIPQDIFSLDFYSPNYLDSLASMGLKRSDKHYTDSLFYSFYCDETFYIELEPMEFFSDSSAIRNPNLNPTRTRPFVNQESDSLDEQVDSVSIGICNCIEPSDIKAIWDERFQNTNLATKEFEERLSILYLINDDELIEAYVQFIDKPMFYTDSIVYEYLKNCDNPLSENFFAFYNRKDGRVKLNSASAQALHKYYNTKGRLYATAVKKTQKEFWEKQNRLDEAARKRFVESLKADNERILENYRKELNMNLDEAYRQLGKARPNNATVSRNRYRTRMRSTGWKNVDRYVVTATRNRETLDFTDKEGNKAVIKYDSIEVELEDMKIYDRVYVYLVGKQQYSFMRMKRNNQLFSQTLNEFIDYSIVAIAFKDGDAYFAAADKPEGRLRLGLNPIDSKRLKQRLSKYGSRQAGKDIVKDQLFQSLKEKSNKRIAENRELKLFRKRMHPIIFPSIKMRE